MDLDTIAQIIALLQDSPVTELSVEQSGQRLRIRRAPGHLPAPVSAAPLTAPPGEHPDGEAAGSRLLTAPMVGLFRHADPPLRFGADVASGQVIGSIESMKLLNDVPAAQAGRVVEILIEEGAPVEYGQALFRLEPA